jgi:predicted acyltransferase
MQNRFYSLDVFRGATVALMILVNNPGTWSHIFPPLEHAPWHGCTPTDLVFPFFLFAVGNAMAFVVPRFTSPTHMFTKVLKRSALIFIIGLGLSWFPFVKWADGALVAKKLANLRILGVLQRIAICYGIASITAYFLKAQKTLYVAFAILLLYWGICIIGAPNNPYGLQTWFGTALDVKILGANHMYAGEGFPFDPEGICSTLGAIAQVMLGYVIGNFIITHGKTPQMLNTLFVVAIALIFIGFCWDMVMPLNKKIWTSSYTIYTTGLATLILGVMIYLIEFKNYNSFINNFFDVFGKNALFIFVLSGLLPRALALIRIPNGLNKITNKPIYNSPLQWVYNTICKPIFTADARVGSFIYALLFLAFMWAIAAYLNKRKIYIKV